MPQPGQEATSTDKSITKCLKNMYEAGHRCVCLNARSIVNKKNELNIMAEDIDPHIIGITESWANRKKLLSKEATRKIVFKQTTWRVYRRTRKDENYANYKEALNLATTEIRKSKRTFEKKLAGNIKNDSKSFYVYVRSKQKVRDKVGTLKNNRGDIISDGFQVAEVLNEYFSSILNTYDISSLPVPYTKFEGNKSEHLGQLVVTPEMIAKKITKMKDNKSPGVDGIPPKLLKEMVEQIST